MVYAGAQPVTGGYAQRANVRPLYDPNILALVAPEANDLGQVYGLHPEVLGLGVVLPGQGQTLWLPSLADKIKAHQEVFGDPKNSLAREVGCSCNCCAM